MFKYFEKLLISIDILWDGKIKHERLNISALVGDNTIERSKKWKDFLMNNIFLIMIII